MPAWNLFEDKAKLNGPESKIVFVILNLTFIH
jgi:hypothetical protein